MSHDLEAGFASSELANIISSDPAPFFGTIGRGGNWNLRAGHESGHNWPLTDGVLLAQNTLANVRDYQIAFEYKRPNEGVHGILTALGQCFTYLEKGYDASVMVIPERYSAHNDPGGHINRVLSAAAPDVPIWLYTYSMPNMSATRPFLNKLQCIRSIDIPSSRTIARTQTRPASANVTTLWAHMREGMSHPDAFYRYCQSVKVVSALGEDYSKIHLPLPLIDAVQRVKPGADPFKYLSNTAGDTISDMAWRYVWFNFYFWNDLMPIFATGAPTYTVNATTTRIKKDSTEFQQLFSGRSDSIKTKLVNRLNAGTITESAAWEEYARKVHSDAHSYREVIDSGLFHIGFLSSDGTLTDLGYKYVDQCERINSADDGIPMEMLRAAVVQNGQYGALLHYIYKMSEERFNANMFDFSTVNAAGNYTFNSDEYMAWIDDQFANTLHISKKSTIRAGGSRKPLQAELSFLKRLGFVKSHNGRTAYRVGVGLEIDWPQVQNSMMYFLSL